MMNYLAGPKYWFVTTLLIWDASFVLTSLCISYDFISYFITDLKYIIERWDFIHSLPIVEKKILCQLWGVC